MAGGIYFLVQCDWCSVEPDPERRYERRQDAIAARRRAARYDGWLLKRPNGVDAVFLCPECVANGH